MVVVSSESTAVNAVLLASLSVALLSSLNHDPRSPGSVSFSLPFNSITVIALKAVVPSSLTL